MSARTNNALLVAANHPQSPITEAYRTLRTNIQFSSAERPVQCVLVTSALKGEGKTNTVSNLAIVHAQERKKVLIIDANLRSPSLHHVFSKQNRTGFSNLICGWSALDEVIEPTHIENLSIMTSGTIPTNPADLLASTSLDSVLKQLRERYDIVLIDSPELLSVTDAQLIAARCDGVVVVVKAGKTKKQQVTKAINRLDHVKAKLLGVVLNQIKS